MDVAIIGGGAAGFFSALSCKYHYPEARVAIFEKTSKVLAKVKISGGGRCNVTYACFNIPVLSKFYPREEKQLKKAFGQFSTIDTVEWFESRGVELKTEPDNRMFPITDSSQTIIDCLMKQCKEYQTTILLNHPVQTIEFVKNHFTLKMKGQFHSADKVIVTTGGSPKLEGFGWLHELGHDIISPECPRFSPLICPGSH